MKPSQADDQSLPLPPPAPPGPGNPEHGATAHQCSWACPQSSPLRDIQEIIQAERDDLTAGMLYARARFAPDWLDLQRVHGEYYASDVPGEHFQRYLEHVTEFMNSRLQKGVFNVERDPHPGQEGR